MFSIFLLVFDFSMNFRFFDEKLSKNRKTTEKSKYHRKFEISSKNRKITENRPQKTKNSRKSSKNSRTSRKIPPPIFPQTNFLRIFVDICYLFFVWNLKIFKHQQQIMVSNARSMIFELAVKRAPESSSQFWKWCILVSFVKDDICIRKITAATIA